MTTFQNLKNCISTLREIELQLSTLASSPQNVTGKEPIDETLREIEEIKKDLINRRYELELEGQYSNNSL